MKEAAVVSWSWCIHSVKQSMRVINTYIDTINDRSPGIVCVQDVNSIMWFPVLVKKIGESGKHD